MAQEDHKERRIKTVMALKRDLEVNEVNTAVLMHNIHVLTQMLFH